MANFLKKNDDAGQNSKSKSLVTQKNNPLGNFTTLIDRKKQIPNASVIYGITGIILIGAAIVNFFGHRPFVAIIVVLVSAMMFGLAWIYYKHSS